MSEHDILAKLDRIAATQEDHGRSIGELVHRVERIEGRVERIDDRMKHLEGGQDDLKTTLGQLMPMLMRILEGQAELRGRIADMPTARDFVRLEGRVAEMSERLPTPLAYQPPSPGKKRAS